MKIFLKRSSLILILLFILFQTSCSDDETSLNITSIKISAEKSPVFLGEEIVLFATNQDGIDITSEVVFYVSDDALNENKYLPEATGDLKFKAEYNAISSSVLNVSVIENITELNFVGTNSSIKAIGSDTCYFKVTNQAGVDVTSLVRIFLGPNRYYSDYYFSYTEGSYQFKAQYFEVESNVFSLEVALNPTVLNLYASRDYFDGNGLISPEFIIVDEDQDTITDFVKIYNNDVALLNNKFTTTSLGEYQFIAKHKNVESNVLTLTALPRKSRKVLIEEFTGEWCGWCPMAAYNIEQLIDEYDGDVLTAAIHNGDGLAYENEGLLRAAFGINYFPSGVVGRTYLGSDIGFNDPTMNQAIIDLVDQEINFDDILLGVDITSSIVGNKVAVDVKVDFFENIDEQLRVTVYLIENNVVSGAQQNYFTNYAGFEGAYYYSQPAILPNFVHQKVLRKVGTDIYGKLIPSSERTENNIYSLPQLEMDISGYDEANTHVIAFVHYPLKDGKKKILNAEQVKVGDTSVGK